MGRFTLILGVAAGILLAPAPAAAQAFDSPESVDEAQACAHDFHDPEMYNWLSFENQCTRAIRIVICSVASDSCNSATTVLAGRKHNTGLSRNDLQRRGGVRWLVCWEGYYPSNANGDYKTRFGDGAYYCRRQ